MKKATDQEIQNIVELIKIQDPRVADEEIEAISDYYQYEDIRKEYKMHQLSKFIHLALYGGIVVGGSVLNAIANEPGEALRLFTRLAVTSCSCFPLLNAIEESKSAKQTIGMSPRRFRKLKKNSLVKVLIDRVKEKAKKEEELGQEV